MAFLVVAAFLMTNKVYSPQYVLWLLPLMILARPKWRDWLIFTAGELIYFVAGLGTRRFPDTGGQLARPDLLALGLDQAVHPRLGRDHGRPGCAAAGARSGTRR